MKVGGVALYSALILLLVLPQKSTSQESSAASTLQVRVSYTGTGSVDEKHKVYVVLWDSPDFVKDGGMPVEIQSTPSKEAVVTFNDVKKTPAYVSAVFDPNGSWDAQSPPPEGSSLGLYSKTPGQAESIDMKKGKTTTIEVTFGDSVKMRSGKAAR